MIAGGILLLLVWRVPKKGSGELEEERGSEKGGKKVGGTLDIVTGKCSHCRHVRGRPSREKVQKESGPGPRGEREADQQPVEGGMKNTISRRKTWGQSTEKRIVNKRDVPEQSGRLELP